MNAPEDMRANRAYDLIRLRHQRDELRRGYPGRRSAGADMDAMRMDYGRRIGAYDDALRQARQDAMMHGNMGDMHRPGAMNDGM